MTFDPCKIGGSSAAAVLGLSPWESRLALWERLRGGPTAKQWAEEEAARLEAGKHMEPLIAERARRRYGAEFQALGDECQPLLSDAEPRIVGHVDGYLRDGSVAEFKMTGQQQGRDGWGEPDTDQVPAHYLAQAIHYLSLVEAPRCVFFVCRVPSWRLDRYVVPRDEGMCRTIRRMELELLAQVDSGEAPDPRTEAEARALWFKSDAKIAVAATDDVMAALTRRFVAQQAQHVLDEVVSQANLTILRHMRDAGSLLGPDGEQIATCTTNKRFDEAEFVARHPAEAAACMGLDAAKVREQFPALHRACMREPTSAPAVRPIRLTKTFKEAARRLVAGQALALPFVPEIEGLFTGDEE